MKRQEIQEQLNHARETVDDPSAVFCIEPFDSVENDGGERMGRLLARLIRDPDRGFMVSTTNAFVFAFGGELGKNGQ